MKTREKERNERGRKIDRQKTPPYEICHRSGTVYPSPNVCVCTMDFYEHVLPPSNVSYVRVYKQNFSKSFLSLLIIHSNKIPVVVLCPPSRSDSLKVSTVYEGNFSLLNYDEPLRIRILDRYVLQGLEFSFRLSVP